MCRYKNRPSEPPAGRKRRLSRATVLNLPLPQTVLVSKIKFLIYSIHLAEGIKCFTPMIMENEGNGASENASVLQHITRAGCLGTGHSAENMRKFPVVIFGARGPIPRTATITPCCACTQQHETQPVETVFQASLGTTKTGKPRQHIQ